MKQMKKLQNQQEPENKEKLNVIYDLILEYCNIFKDFKNDYYCSYGTHSNGIVMNIESEKFKNWLLAFFYEKEGKFLRQEDVKNIIPHLKFTKSIISVDYCISLRCVHLNNEILIDLCNEENKFIKISARNFNVESSYANPLFVQNSSMKNLPIPSLNSSSSNLLPLLQKYFVFDYEQLLLLSVYLCTCFISDIPSPLLLITGEKGSSKSTATEFIKNIVDPCINTKTIIQRNSKNLAVQLNSSYMVAFDNVSERTINDEISDILCTAVTGGSITDRKLFTNNETSHLFLNNKIIINGISSYILKNSDILDRTLILEAKRIDETKRKSIVSLHKEFNEDLPLILGSICNILSKAISIRKDVHLPKTNRLIDFHTWGYAIAEALDNRGNEFNTYLNTNVSRCNTLFLEDNIIATSILEFMKDKDKISKPVGELFIELQNIALTKGTHSASSFPKQASAFSSKLDDIKSNLSSIGIDFSKKNIGTCKEITITNSRFQLSKKKKAIKKC